MSTTMRFTVAEYDRMIEQGIFSEWPELRMELIHGETREMSTREPAHEDTVDLLSYWSIDNTPRTSVRVRIQNSLGIPDMESVTVPDVAWMRAKSYRRQRPQPNDVLLLIEVTESSLEYDRGEKADLYAAAGIKDYWIVNMYDLCVEVCRKPRGGKYREVKKYQIGQTVSPLAFPSVTLEVSTVFAK